tara:strand:+ start:187 stop:714 length:528 start_codon:yes stop_codon:yes gene_type:complete
MAITSSNIKFYLSGGISNADVNASIGGAISSTEVTDNSLHNLFDKTLGTESTAGDTEYRCIYVKNTHGSLELELAKIWISTNTTSPANVIAIALAGEGKGGTAETLSPDNEDTPPSGETFSQPTAYSTGLSLDGVGTGLGFGISYPIWIRRTIAAGATAVDNVTFVLSVQGDTAA